jgi:hypothetical protein
MIGSVVECQCKWEAAAQENANMQLTEAQRTSRDSEASQLLQKVSMFIAQGKVRSNSHPPNLTFPLPDGLSLF